MPTFVRRRRRPMHTDVSMVSMNAPLWSTRRTQAMRNENKHDKAVTKNMEETCNTVSDEDLCSKVTEVGMTSAASTGKAGD